MFFLFTFPIFLMMPLNNTGLMEAKDISGTYLLSSVPETAGGFRFMTDSTFGMPACQKAGKFPKL
jgi:hypothetical protein